MKFQNLLRNTPFGILLGSIVTLSLACLYDSSVSQEVKRNFTYLVTASFSLVGATLALIGVFSNIEHQTLLKEKERLRSLQAVRIGLPRLLSKTIKICKAGTTIAAELPMVMLPPQRNAFLDKISRSCEIPDEVVSTLSTIVELSDDPVLASRCAGVLRDHQVYFARLQARPDEIIDPNFTVSESNRKELIVSWAFLFALVGSLFDYARGEEETITLQIGEEEISSALHQTLDILDVEAYRDEIGLYARTFERRYQ